MKVERLLYGMQTGDGKIFTKLSEGAYSLLEPKSRDSLKALRVEDTKKYRWFKTEQTLVYSVIIKVACKDPSQGGREWVQNESFLVNIHDFFSYVQQGKNPFEVFEANLFGELEKFPDSISSLNV